MQSAEAQRGEFLLHCRNYNATLLALDKLHKSSDLLSRSSYTILQSLFTQLQEENLPVGMLHVLYAKSRSTEFIPNFENFLVLFANFVDNVDNNVIQAPASVVTQICSKICEVLQSRRQTILGINLLSSVISKLQVNTKQLTAVHSFLLQLCLDSQTLKAAVPFLIDDIDSFTNDLQNSESLNLLLYYYYSGLVHFALKNYAEGIFFMEACIRIPATTLSHVMLEAYKKFILYSLIHLGDVPNIHKSAVQIVNRVLKPVSAAYTELIPAFQSSSPNELQTVINRHIETYRRDHNSGLIKQLISAQTKLNIQRLTKTFLTLSLSDVAARTQLNSAQEAEIHLRNMIQSGEIYAKINQRDGMVLFHDNNQKYNNKQVLKHIDDQIFRCVMLNRRLSSMNESVSTNPEFISKIIITNTNHQDNDDALIASSSTSSKAFL